MSPILWAPESFGPYIEARTHYCNHLVFETDHEPQPDSARPFAWKLKAPSGRWQFGWVLTRGVRLEPYEDGTLPNRRALWLLAGVRRWLGEYYGARPVDNYANPAYPAHGAQMVDTSTRSLQSLVTFAEMQTIRGRSVSAKKRAAGRRAAEINNRRRTEAAQPRWTRLLELREVEKLTLAEIAERENTTVNAIKSALARAREAERQDEAAAKGRVEAHRAHRRSAVTLTPDQRRAADAWEEDYTVEPLPNGWVRVQWVSGDSREFGPRFTYADRAAT